MGTTIRLLNLPSKFHPLYEIFFQGTAGSSTWRRRRRASSSSRRPRTTSSTRGKARSSRYGKNGFFQRHKAHLAVSRYSTELQAQKKGGDLCTCSIWLIWQHDRLFRFLSLQKCTQVSPPTPRPVLFKSARCFLSSCVARCSVQYQSITPRVWDTKNQTGRDSVWAGAGGRQR